MKIQKEKNKNVHKIRTGKFNKSKNKKLIIGAGILVGLVMLLGIFVLIFSVNRNNQTLSGKTEELNAGGIVNGDKGYISSAQIIQTKTGTGPWDANDEPGNDSSEDNNIVRSFDQVTWTVDLTMALKSGVVDSGLTGGIINVEATLPETCADVMKWDLDSMKWIEKGNVSTDGRTLTGQYSMLETETTIPGKQTLVFVLGVEGAGNKTEIIPTFTFELEGNEENDKVTITGDKIIVSAKGKYNIKLNRNVQLADKTTVDYGEGNTSGRMYGYSFELQIYNENESKELKGIEYPNGDITFDIDLKLERSRFGSNELEDITDEATPILWNYRVNDWTSTNIEGNIPGRNMHTGNGYFLYNLQVPLGKFREAEYSTYNSGNIKITQEGSSLKVVVSDYKLNGTFPYYESSYSGNTHRSKIYTENIGTFSVGYMQIFVPDTEASTIENRNYYLTVSDSNMRVTSITNQILTSQMSTSDDTSRISHVIYSPGTYSHITYFYDTNFKLLSTTTSTGDSKETIGNIVMALSKFDISLYSDNDIYTANKFYKFDGECFEPIYYNNARYIKRNMGGNAQFRVWYVTKKDGKNWTSQTELNNANIEDMDIYDNIEDIPENKICVGVYVESIDGYISKYTGDNNGLVIPLKIKETATIGSTYSINVRTQVWTYQLDRNIYSIVHPENKYPTPTWDSGNLQYIKTEYDENGEIISGTHNGGARWGNTLLAIGANLHGEIKAINGSNEEKVNYDLGKNESIVTYSVEPQLDGNTNITSQIENVTLKAEVTLPQGLTYIPGSSEYGEPEITNNSNGSQTLIWYIYGVISGQAIEPIRFNAQIDNESENGQQYETKFVISEVIGTDGISKIGNSKVDFRTSTETINVINLASHRLYKEVEIPIIEKNGQIKYNISYSNNTDETVSDFQLLDILPYNGDSRGTEFEGTYMLESVKVNQMISASTQSTDNLQLFTTNSDNVKSMTAKDTGIGVDSIWSEKTIGASLNENTTGFAIKGEIVGKSRLDIEITLNTTGNAPENVYANNAMAQVYTDSEQMQTGTVQAQVVSRKIQGKVWEDSNRNGVIDSSEKYLEGTTVKLLNSTNNAEVTRTTTNAQGEYEFTDLAKGTYKVEVAIDDLHELTDKEVGTNKEINSKFNQSTKQTDEITKLNTISSPEIIEENVNAGIRTIQYNINTKVEGAGGNISGEGQDIYESVDKGENSVKDIIISPNIGYRVNTITVNGEPIEFTEEENHIVILNKFINMQENKEVIVTFKKIETSVLVHHYKENTTEQLSKDVTINGEVGDDYTTQVATDIPQNYELVETPAYASGKMTEDQIVVTYYYRLKTPDIANQNINKTGTDRMTVANQEMSYTVTYTANVTDYIGNAEVTIVDTLPYVIDEGKSDLVGGTYDSASKTITWKENVTDLDSYDGKGTVNITKTFKVVYVGLDMNQEKITNNVKGHIKLLTPEKTSEEVTGDQDATIYKAIISSEKLVDKTEAIEGEKVTYTIRITNDGNLEKTVTVRDTLPAGITFDKDTLIQVGDTGTVYTEQNLKNGIPVEVPASGSIDVVFAGKVDTLANNEYSKTLTNQATVDNEPTNEVTTNVTKANITAHKEAEPSSGNKVREGDEITYRIKVRNDGTRAGDVIVKDTIPTGTTFVEGSIKIDNVADSSKTATDLANGITLNVPISTEKVVEFKVRVNKLIDGTKIKNTAYINQNGEDKKVPEEPEHTYVEPKEEQNITKTGTTTIESLDQEITYNINYTAKITDYSGRAIVKLVDKLPYAIDEASSDLAGGTYDAQAQTITWEEPVENIQITEEKEITVNKTIKVVYKDVSPDVVSIKNVVTGHIEYETPVMTSDEVTANATTTTGFTVNIPVSKVWEDDSNKLGQRPTKVVFKLHGSDGSEYIKEMSKPGTQGSTTTQDSTNPNKWNDIFENLPKYDSNNQEIVYTLTEEEKTEGDLKYYDSVVTDKTITNTNKYGKVTVHHYIMNTDGSTTTTRVPDAQGQDVQDTVIEGKEGNPYTTEETKNINEKYELVAEKLPANATGIIEKYNEEKPQEVIYYYRLKPAKVLINYLEKDEDTDDSNNLVLTTQEQIDGYVDDSYNTDTDNRKETIEKDGKTYTLVSDSGNKTGNMTLQDITVTYYYLQNTKATVRYVERDPETAEIVKDLEQPTVKEGLVGDEFVTNEKAFIGYKLVESPEKTTIEMTKEEQTLIYYYEPVYTGLIENHIDDKTGKILETETHEIQVGENYNIPSKEFEGYDLVEEKLPANAEGTMGEEVVTVNYYYIKKAVLEVNYIDIYTNKPLIGQIVDNTKHEGDLYTTEQKTFENYDLVEVPSNASGTIEVETDEEGNITNNRTVVTYYYTQRAIVEEHHIDSLTGKDIEEPTIHNGHVGDEYNIPSKEFLSYKLIEEDEEGNSMLPTNSQGIMTAEKIVVNYYYNQPAKVIVHYVEKATGKELEELNEETGEPQSSQVTIEGFNQDEYTTEAKEFKYYTLIETPENKEGQMKVEIVEDEEGNKTVNNTIDVYYYYQAKPFNIGVEKEITGIVVNGESRTPTNGKLERIEIYRKDVEKTNIQIVYRIRVINNGEVEGAVTIEDKLPEGMSLANNDGTWEEQDGVLRKIIPEINPGETKEYTVVLDWNTAENNMGEKDNIISIVDTQNVPGFIDNNDKDNTSNANVIISVETGELPIGLILALVALVGLETITLRYAVVLTKRQKKK